MNEQLFSDFAPASKNDWLERVAKELKGRPVEELNWAIDEGIEMPPSVHREEVSKADKPAIGQQQLNNDWRIGEQFDAAEGAKAVNALLMEALQKGVEAPLIRFDAIPKDWDWSEAFRGLMPEMVFLNFDFGEMPQEDVRKLLDGLMAWLTSVETDKAALKGAISASAAEVLIMASQKLPAFDLYCIDGRLNSTDNTKPVEELTQSLEAAMQLLDAWTEEGEDVSILGSKIYFKIGVGTSYFVEIAKIRAFHLLWANVLSAYGLPPSRANLEAHLSAASQTEDKHNNMIRATTQALSAAIGGVSRLYIAPANASFEAPTAFTRRVARNLQHVLKMESFLDRVVDPAAGSYYIEQLTLRLANAVWGRLGEQVSGER